MLSHHNTPLEVSILVLEILTTEHLQLINLFPHQCAIDRGLTVMKKINFLATEKQKDRKEKRYLCRLT